MKYHVRGSARVLVRYAGAFWQVLGDAIVGRTATVIMVALLATLIAMGCASERPPSPRKNAEPPVVVAAGDIAGCDTEGDEATARLVRDISDATVLTLGDNAYPDGSIENFHECYGPTWGWFKERTNPTPGNHEYHTEGAKGYFDYFLESAGDPDEGYYSFDLGAWHLVALNSNCEEVGGCGASSPQVRWLKADLAKDDESCTMAYFHHPLFTSGEYRPGIREVRPLWKALYAARADVVLNGHDHNYQRFSPQDPSSTLSIHAA
jgi:hypothetical protein